MLYSYAWLWIVDVNEFLFPFLLLQWGRHTSSLLFISFLVEMFIELLQ